MTSNVCPDRTGLFGGGLTITFAEGTFAENVRVIEKFGYIIRK